MSYTLLRIIHESSVKVSSIMEIVLCYPSMIKLAMLSIVPIDYNISTNVFGKAKVMFSP